MSEEKQLELSEIFDPYDEWHGMPEFKQENIKPFAEIKIRFASEDDLKEFAEIIGQALTVKTKSIWHPKLVRGVNSKKRWVDEK